MIPDSLAAIILLLGGMATFVMVMWMFHEFHWLSTLCAAVAAAFMAIMITGVVNAMDRTKSEQPKFYAVQDVGTVEAPKDIAVISNGEVFDITGRFYVVLYNPELYYLEEQSYTCPCKGWCLVTYKKAPTYRVVPRSLVEVQ